MPPCPFEHPAGQPPPCGWHVHPTQTAPPLQPGRPGSPHCSPASITLLPHAPPPVVVPVVPVAVPPVPVVPVPVPAQQFTDGNGGPPLYEQPPGTSVYGLVSVHRIRSARQIQLLHDPQPPPVPVAVPPVPVPPVAVPVPVPPVVVPVAVPVVEHIQHRVEQVGSVLHAPPSGHSKGRSGLSQVQPTDEHPVVVPVPVPVPVAVPAPVPVPVVPVPVPPGQV